MRQQEPQLCARCQPHTAEARQASAQLEARRKKMSLSDDSEWHSAVEDESAEKEEEYVYDDWPDHSKPYVHRSQNQFDMSAGLLERFLCSATTSQLDRIDAVAAALAAKRAELRPQARPRPEAPTFHPPRRRHKRLGLLLDEG